MKFLQGVVIALLLLCPFQVSAVDMLTNEVLCLTTNIYYESRGEPISGQYQVAFVTMNRVKSSRYPNTVCEVIKQKKQFSWYKKGRIYPRNISKDKAWRRSVKIALQVITKNSSFPDVTKGALWYHAKYAKPLWRYSLLRVALVGNHIFYKKK